MSAGGIDRRGFLACGAGLVASIAIGYGVRPLAAEADVVRPPGSLAEGEFMARCISCDRCISVCHTDIIEPIAIEDGILQARTPRLSYEDGSCDFCDKCRQVCPTGAIGTCDPLDPLSGRIGVARVIPEACIAYIENGACGVCVDACPYDALYFDELRQVHVDDTKCNGCGECVRVCKANVFTSFSGSERGIEVVTEKTFAEQGGAS